MSGGDFLARWSKRKRAVAPPAPPAAGPSDAAAGTETPGQVADGEIRGLDGEEAGLLPPEELAKLPSLESLTAETDLTQFLRAGVPMLMRKAALRRMWSLDTNIRDYVGEAREYAYDWNAIGGVPGNGPMLPTDDIKAMLREIFDGTPVAEVEPEPQPGEPEADEARVGGAEADAAETAEIVQTDSGSPTGDEAADAPRSEPRQLPASTGEGALPPSPEAAPAARARRHGGAVPL